MLVLGVYMLQALQGQRQDRKKMDSVWQVLYEPI
jgi:hypothetical protein